MNQLLRIITSAAIALAVLPAAHAQVVRWTLHNVVFEDGGTASGYFDVDSRTGELALTPPLPPGDPFFDPWQGYDITTTAGSVLPAHHFYPWPTGGTGFHDHYVDDNGFFDDGGNSDYNWTLRLVIEGDWRFNTSGRFIIAGGLPSCQPNFQMCSGQWTYQGWPEVNASRAVLSGGYITGAVVPEPAVSYLIVIGLAALAVAARRSKGVKARVGSLRG